MGIMYYTYYSKVNYDFCELVLVLVCFLLLFCFKFMGFLQVCIFLLWVFWGFLLFLGGWVFWEGGWGVFSSLIFLLY